MNHYDTLNAPQREAVFYTEGPLLILAGAGSGKTRVLTHRTAYLIEEKKVDPFRIMAITFTNKAAGEMRDRIDQMVGFGSESIWVATFHATCVRILRRYIDLLGFDHNFTIYDTDDQKTLLRAVLKEMQIDTKKVPEKTFQNAISKAKDELLDPDRMEQMAGSDYAEKQKAQVYREYQKRLKKNNALDFDDLIFKTVELFRANPAVLEAYQERFRYIMVDEYQDTNTAQFQLIKQLSGKYRNLCVVGDDDQSIYKFRGANIQNILKFERFIPDAKVIKLEHNYRSTQTILDAANGVISNNRGRKAKRLWTGLGAGEPIHLKGFEYAQEEAEFVVRDIKRAQRLGEVSFGDCAVLYRTNAQSRLLEEQFVLSNVPYRIFGGVNFYARKEVKDMLAYLKTIDNGADDLAVRRILNVPKRGIGQTTIDRVTEYAADRGISLYDALRRADEIPSLGRAASRITPFVNLIRLMRSKLPYLKLSDLIEDILETSGYVEELKAEAADRVEADTRMENLGELISKCRLYEEKCHQQETQPTLSGFLEEVALVAEIDTLSETNDYVVLMTLHSAKGLEFPDVYMVGMEDGLFPGFLSIAAADESELEEERRLCYVGITRAMRRLTVTHAQRRMIYGQTHCYAPSRFLFEIDPKCFDYPPQKRAGESIETKQNTYQEAKKAFSRPVSYTAPKPSSFGAVATPTSLAYGVGDRVKHLKFGAGTVTEIANGGKDFEVTVNFDRVGTKKMFSAFANLQKL